MKGANLEGSIFNNANLKGARLEGAVLRNTKFRYADLRNVKLAGVKTGSDRVDPIDITGARMSEATELPDGTNWNPNLVEDCLLRLKKSNFTWDYGAPPYSRQN